MLNLSTLNPQQRQAVETIRGPVLILAGAGTGKTRVITFRIAHMVERGISPDNILAVTFTNKAAREMMERVGKLLPKQPRSASPDGKKSPKPTICTFHSLCVRILREHIEKLGYKKNFVIYDATEQLSVIKKVLAKVSEKGEKVDPGMVLGLVSKFKNSGEDAMRFVDPNSRVLASLVKARYDSALRACNAVDFDDLILLALRLFTEHPEALESCRAKYQYVMVDEYQDTNSAQFRLIHFLTQEHRNFCVVGDDDQSIYGWRGADITNLLDMEKHYPEVKVIKLEQNYRSTNTILNAANAVIKLNTQRRGKKLWSDKGDGARITLHVFKDEEEEGRSIVEQIEYARATRQIPWAEQAILFRTNAQARPLETALRQGGVRYHLIGGQSFFDRREVRDFLAYLKTFMNPHDDVSLLRIANVPARGLSDVTMERLVAASHERKCSVYTVMKNPAVTTTLQSKTRESLEKFVELVDRCRAQLAEGGAPQDPRALEIWSSRFLAETGYLDDLRRSEKNPEVADARIRNLTEALETMDHPEMNGKPLHERLETYLEEVTLDNNREEDKDEPGDAVTLITMHSCKGLEFPHVYVVGMEDGLLPHARAHEEGTLDEERRLFYVAITRAMKTLSLSHCSGRRKYGKMVSCTASPFLRDLPEDLVEDADEKAKQAVTPTDGKSRFDALRALLD
jgi:superfamily I DNA/RNA helicase